MNDRKMNWVLLFLVLISAALITDTVYAIVDTELSKRAEKEEVATWEYHIEYTFRDYDRETLLTRKINELGEEGWEYVGYIMNDGTNARYIVFKRPTQ